jgi:nitrogen fixation/metabolism regulation signal transduction histidine kinase
VLQSVGAIVFSTAVFSAGFLLFYWFSYIAGDNLFREFVVVYKQIAISESVEVDGRTVERRSYSVEAQPETARWKLILPPLLINNLLVAVVLSVFAIWYSHRIAGPVFRITSDVRSALRGNRQVRITLRKKDELRDLAEQINLLLDELDEVDGDD